MWYGCYANGFRFDSHLADFLFFLYFFSGLRVTFMGCCWVKVRFRVYLLRLVRFYQAYCTLVVHYCYVTSGVCISFQIFKRINFQSEGCFVALCWKDLWIYSWQPWPYVNVILGITSRWSVGCDATMRWVFRAMCKGPINICALRSVAQL